MIFLLAGFVSVTTAVCFLLHELVVNPHVQQKLYEEILTVEKELNGEPLQYDALKKLKYLDMVFSETMRLWPSLGVNERSCTKPYVVENTDGTKVQINVGDAVYFSYYGIQRDPQYYPNPNKFDPDRFDETKNTIPSGTFFPFGSGPRK